MILSSLRRRVQSVARAISFATFSAGVSSCSAGDVSPPNDWLVDCVGRMQLSLPGKTDVAANSYKMLEAEYKIGTQQPAFEFQDGQRAGYSLQQYLGRIFVSHPLPASQRQALLAAAKEGLQRAKKYAARKKTDASGKPLVFEALSMPADAGVAYRVSGFLEITAVLDPIVVRASSHDSEGTDGDVRRDFAMKTKGLSLRSFGELPKSPGVCLPYAFVKDDGRERRAIGTTYRLQDHPDVTIWLQDASADAPQPDQDPDKFTAEYRTYFFWRQDYQSRKAFRSLWNDTKDVRVDGRKGVASFVELKREDDTLDFGYLAVVKGNPSAKQDEPDLMLFVIRDAKNALERGKQPIEKEALLDMAQRIAASVKHRPVQ